MSTQAPKDQVFHMEGDVTTTAVKNYEWEKLKERVGQLQGVIQEKGKEFQEVKVEKACKVAETI